MSNEEGIVKMIKSSAINNVSEMAKAIYGELHHTNEHVSMLGREFDDLKKTIPQLQLRVRDVERKLGDDYDFHGDDDLDDPLLLRREPRK